jgi:hypothetical protein
MLSGIRLSPGRAGAGRPIRRRRFTAEPALQKYSYGFRVLPLLQGITVSKWDLQ